MKNPCFNCPDRTAKCHASCEKYGAWRKAKDEQFKKAHLASEASRYISFNGKKIKSYELRRQKGYH